MTMTKTLTTTGVWRKYGFLIRGITSYPLGQEDSTLLIQKLIAFRGKNRTMSLASYWHKIKELAVREDALAIPIGLMNPGHIYNNNGQKDAYVLFLNPEILADLEEQLLQKIKELQDSVDYDLMGIQFLIDFRETVTTFRKNLDIVNMIGFDGRTDDLFKGGLFLQYRNLQKSLVSISAIMDYNEPLVGPYPWKNLALQTKRVLTQTKYLVNAE